MAALIAAPPMDSGSVGAGGSEESVAAAFKAAAGLSKHRAANIPTANLKILKSIVAFFHERGEATLASPRVERFKPAVFSDLRAMLLPSPGR